MKMRFAVVSLFAFALVLSAVPLLAENNQAIENDLKAKEQAAWQAFKDKNAKAFGDILTDDAINIAGGMMQKGKQEIVKGMDGCTVNNFSLSDFSFLWIDKDAVIITYTGTQDATCGGQKQPGKVLASSVWQKKGGKWLSSFHQETTTGGM